MCMRVCVCVCLCVSVVRICVICLYVCKCLYASSLSILNFRIMLSQDALSEQWDKKPVYVVGAATGSAVRSLGLSPLGEEIEQAPHYSIKYISHGNTIFSLALFCCMLFAVLWTYNCRSVLNGLCCCHHLE